MECFAVYTDNIEGRIDPLYLKNVLVLEKIKTKFSLMKLGSLLKHDVQYGANESAINGDPEKDVRYIRITDIDEFGNLKNNDWKTSQIIEKKYELNEGDILFARSGATAGKCFYYKNEYGKSIFAGYLIRFVFNEKKVNPKYIFYYSQLNHFKLWIITIQRPSGQPNINSEEFKSFKIPLPSLSTQNHIVQIMDNAYKIKKQKKSEARQLLNSIDEFVIQKLKINFEEKKRTTFSINLDNIKNRLDPLFYSTDLYYFLNNSEYPDATIESISNKLKIGFAAGKNDQNLNKEGIIQIRPTNINQQRQLVFEKCIYIDFKQKEKRNTDLLNNKDILFNNTNSQELVGKSTFFNIEGNYFCSNHITRIRVKKEKINPLYLTHILNLYQRNNFFFRICTNWNNQSGINVNLLNTIKIPLLPLSIQNKIAEEVKRRMQKAERLQKEAKQLMEEAKEKVEKMILSE